MQVKINKAYANLENVQQVEKATKIALEARNTSALESGAQNDQAQRSRHNTERRKYATLAGVAPAIVTVNQDLVDAHKKAKTDLYAKI